jgi:hypothetical protein
MIKVTKTVLAGPKRWFPLVSEFSFQQFNKNHLLDLVFLLLLADGLVFSSQSNGVQAKPEGVWREPKRYEGMNRGDLESNH